jgi:hypothetical protein
MQLKLIWFSTFGIPTRKYGCGKKWGWNVGANLPRFQCDLQSYSSGRHDATWRTNIRSRHACEVCRDTGVDFVKSSTGLGTAGATVEDILLMRRTVGDSIGVKASGGIHDLECALAMIDAGANRKGTSCGVSIMQELHSDNKPIQQVRLLWF